MMMPSLQQRGLGMGEEGGCPAPRLDGEWSAGHDVTAPPLSRGSTRPSGRPAVSTGRSSFLFLNTEGRKSILRIHSRRMPLASDVNLDRLAQITHAFVGADLEALCKEAGMVALRRYLSLEGENHLKSILESPDHLQIIMEDFLTALREIEPTATREFFTERSTVRLDHVGGLRKIKEILLSIVDWPAKYPDLFASGKVLPPRGILFVGPSGTGKTMMARALAGETGLNFISVGVPIIFSKWLGESEKALHNIFKKAKQSAPAFFFDD
jgi:transitional endoplasmic reticulum ATPase